MGPDPQLSYIASNNTPVLRFNLAVNTGYKDKTHCSWYRCSYFGERAETLAPHLAKGKFLLVTGEPEIKDFTNEAGKTFRNVEVRVKDIDFLGTGSGAPAAGGATEDSQQLDDDGVVPF